MRPLERDGWSLTALTRPKVAHYTFFCVTLFQDETPISLKKDTSRDVLLFTLS